MSNMSNRRFLFKNQDYYKIKRDCLENEKLFEDDFFEYNIPGTTWLRPGKITREPRFFVEGASRFDVVQGNTTDCWLIVAMANLTMNQTLLQHVVPKNQSFRENYVGMFFFRIWQCGNWVEVVVDDRLPTKGGELIYARSRQKNEFWSALLEKAFAKLYGTYGDLKEGWFCEGMVDLTGGIVERVNLPGQPKNIAYIVDRSLKKSSLMCVFMPNNPSIKEEVLTEGLVKGHAYSITGLINFGGNDVNRILVRLMNPWGKIEWNGAWSDSSPEWRNVPEEEKKKIGLVSREDGEFWMSIVDFTKHFLYIDICHLSHGLFENIGGEGNIGWEENNLRGEWIKGVNAGGFIKETFHLNPQYRITLTDTDYDQDNLCTVIISLMQKNKNRLTWHPINVTAFLLDGPEQLSKHRLSEKYISENFRSSMSSKLRLYRENVVRDTFEPGVYCIIPSTRYPNQEGQYLLRVYSEKGARMDESEEFPQTIRAIEALSQSLLKEEALSGRSSMVTEDQKPICKKVLKKNDQEIEEYFHKIAGNDGEINWEELQSVLDYALGIIQDSGNAVSTETGGSLITTLKEFGSWLTKWYSKPEIFTHFTKDKCRRLIKMLDDDSTGKLGFNEFKILLKKIREWETVFLMQSNETETIIVPELKQALASAGYNVNTSDLGRLVRRYSDSSQKLGFDDFVMCAVEIETDWI